jgi:hypothetical protein
VQKYRVIAFKSACSDDQSVLSVEICCFSNGGTHTIHLVPMCYEQVQCNIITTANNNNDNDDDDDDDDNNNNNT